MTATTLQTKPGTWTDLYAKVISDDDNRVDYNIKWKDLAVLPNLEDGTLAPLATFRNLTGQDSRTMSERAYRQYLTKLGVSYKHATLFTGDLQDRMIQERLAKIVDDKPLVSPDADIFLRARPGQVRAILSGRYGDMRDREVADILNDLIPRLDGYEVLMGRAVDHVFSVTLLGKDPVFENGDRYFPIHVVRNSEVGYTSFNVTSGICKGACSNGMIFGHRKDSSVRIRHLGKKMRESVIAALHQSFTSVDQWAAKIGPAIEKAKSIQIDLADEKQATKAVKELRDRGLTKKFAQRVVAFSQVLPQETYGTEFLTGSETLVTRWHLVNSMTHLAQEESFDIDLRHEVEAVAGGLLLARAA
jgi:hypothetical protein